MIAWSRARREVPHRVRPHHRDAELFRDSGVLARDLLESRRDGRRRDADEHRVGYLGQRGDRRVRLEADDLGLDQLDEADAPLVAALQDSAKDPVPYSVQSPPWGG